IQLPHNGKSIRGSVHDRKGLPVPAALIALSGSRPSLDHTTVSRPDGSFLFESVPDGPRRIRVAAARFCLWAADIDPEEDRQTVVDVILDQGGRVAGVVRAADGKAMQDVSVGSGEGLLGTWTRSAVDGNYALEGLDSGPIQLVADGDERG